MTHSKYLTLPFLEDNDYNIIFKPGINFLRLNFLITSFTFAPDPGFLSKILHTIHVNPL